MSNTALVKQATVDALVKAPAVQERFKEVLRDRAPQFISSLIAVSRGLVGVEPKSIVASAMQAATLDLPIEKSLGFAWIVPYKSKGELVAQFQLGYRGYIQLAQRTGKYSRMGAKEVYEAEFVSYDPLAGELVLKPNYEPQDDEKPVGYAASFTLTNGFRRDIYWTRRAIEAHAQRYSQAYRKAVRDKFGPWFENFDKMALKTVIKDLISHWGPLSIEMQQALQVDDTVTHELNGEAVNVEVFTAESQAQFEVQRPEIPETAAQGEAPKPEEKPAPAPAAEPKPAAAPRPAAKKTLDPLASLRAKMEQAGIDEATVLDFARKNELIEESIGSLDDANEVTPTAIRALNGGFDGMLQEIKAGK